MCSVKVYISQFLALSSTRHNHSVYLYLRFIREKGNVGNCTGGVGVEPGGGGVLNAKSVENCGFCLSHRLLFTHK